MRVAITGCNRGIGRAVARALAQDGASLLLHARGQGPLEAMIEEARGLGAAQVLGVAGDLREEDLGQRLAEAGSRDLGGLDVVLLNAAILGPMVPMVELESSDLSEVLDIGVVRQAALARAFLPSMVAQGQGAIVWMSSLLGRFGLPNYGAYAAMKHGLEGLSRVVAQEHGDDGIISLTIAPGMVQTEMLKAALGQEDVSDFQTPEHTAQGFLRLFRALEPSMNGSSLDIEPWLP